ncbi:MAG TPA: hypothetical protein VND23_00025, partial [Acidimicrobiales bacterium]|nr:hypothetical protein [Acidimicrobiales bacterium]
MNGGEDGGERREREPEMWRRAAPDPGSRSPGPTPSQTVGPYLALGFAPLATSGLDERVRPGSIVVVGHVLDGAGTGLSDAVVESWHDGAAHRTDAGHDLVGECRDGTRRGQSGHD